MKLIDVLETKWKEDQCTAESEEEDKDKDNEDYADYEKEEEEDSDDKEEEEVEDCENDDDDYDDYLDVVFEPVLEDGKRFDSDLVQIIHNFVRSVIYSRANSRSAPTSHRTPSKWDDPIEPFIDIYCLQSDTAM